MGEVTNKLKRGGGGNTMFEELDLREFKQFIYGELKSDPVLRDRILDVPDKIGVDEFLEKTSIWLELLKKEENRGRL